MVRLILFIILSSVTLNAQYSNYYSVNKNVRVSGNINISSNENKTIRTIDYAALARANALVEKNRLERMKFIDEQSEKKEYEIAEDPSKAYDYGKWVYYKYSRKERKDRGLKKYNQIKDRIVTNNQLIDLSNGIFNNLSKNFITSEFINFGIFNALTYFPDYRNVSDLESFVILNMNIPEGGKLIKADDWRSEVWDGDEVYVHKTEISRTKVRGHNGFKGSIFYETKYEKGILEYYASISDGVLSLFKANFKGDSNEVSFEDIEGRRFYFRTLAQKAIANSSFMRQPFW
tara:strand:+ start:151 stop:1017 length:867 start_codon:yes stop_codon:yes gene_type:complete